MWNVSELFQRDINQKNPKINKVQHFPSRFCWIRMKPKLTDLSSELPTGKMQIKHGSMSEFLTGNSNSNMAAPKNIPNIYVWMFRYCHSQLRFTASEKMERSIRTCFCFENLQNFFIWKNRNKLKLVPFKTVVR